MNSIATPKASLICQDGAHRGFLASAEAYPDRPALEVGKNVCSYAELRAAAASVAATLMEAPSLAEIPLAGVFATRTTLAYAGVLGTLMANRGVVPLNPTFPVERTATMIEQAELKDIVADSRGVAQLPALLKLLPRSIRFILPDTEDVQTLVQEWPMHTFVSKSQVAAPEKWQPQPANSESIAYLLFTSGSTGTPKGVTLLHRNLAQFIRVTRARYDISEQDRFSQFYEPTFDSGLFDLYICWEAGASLCSPEPNQLLNPGKFIIDKELTVIDMVPSTGHMMMKVGTLKPEKYPKLRIVRLGGEAVSADLARAWSLAAPNAIVENNYGPSEATVDVVSYRWNPATSPTECELGTAPIGYPYEGTEPLIVDGSLQEVPVGGEGELLVTGPQVAPGYWRDPARTAQAFVVPPGKTKTYYRTGDLVRRPAPGRPICFVGRNDFQIKVYGVRIELGEVEAALRDVAKTPVAVAVGWPLVPSGAAGIVAFLDKPDADVKDITLQLKARLPSVMVPREIRLLEHFPLNPNGKVDRKALMELLAKEPGVLKKAE